MSTCETCPCLHLPRESFHPKNLLSLRQGMNPRGTGGHSQYALFISFVVSCLTWQTLLNFKVRKSSGTAGVLMTLSMKVKLKDQWESGKRNVMTFPLSYGEIKSDEIFFRPANLLWSTHLNHYLLSTAPQLPHTQCLLFLRLSIINNFCDWGNKSGT